MGLRVREKHFRGNGGRLARACPVPVWPFSYLRSHGIARALHLSHTSPLFLLFSIRWQQTSKSSGLSSGLQPAGAKADALREEMEEAANRVEICRVPLPPPSLLLLTGTDGATLRESLFPPLALY